ncbi:MAG: integrase/recombinase XerD, partial [Paracoccaceae bacterium]
MRPRIAIYLEAARAELDVADNTVLAYDRDLQDFSAFTQKRGVAFEDISRATIQAYLVSLDRLGLAASTRARRLSAIRQFFRFAYEESWRVDNPASQIK